MNLRRIVQELKERQRKETNLAGGRAVASQISQTGRQDLGNGAGDNGKML